MAPTPEDLVNVPFTEPLRGEWGYRARDVDPLMRRAAAALAGSDDLAVLHDLHAVRLRRTWNWFVRRYREDQVEAMLELCAYTVAQARRSDFETPNCPQCREFLNPVE